MEYPKPVDIYVHGPGSDQYIYMFLKQNDRQTQWYFNGVNSAADADIVVFTGGEDVDPALYGENKLTCTFSNTERDDVDQGVYWECYGMDIPMVGICRGGQFLNVINGGKMWQDVNNHGAAHFLIDLKTEEKRWVTSTHHQMMIPDKDAQILAIAAESTRRISFGKEEGGKTGQDIEALWYEDTKSLCFQPHPEFMNYKDCTGYFFELLDRHVMPVVEANWAEDNKVINEAFNKKVIN